MALNENLVWRGRTEWSRNLRELKGTHLEMLEVAEKAIERSPIILKKIVLFRKKNFDKGFSPFSTPKSNSKPVTLTLNVKSTFASSIVFEILYAPHFLPSCAASCSKTTQLSSLLGPKISG
jgi:hypothetical protein